MLCDSISKLTCAQWEFLWHRYTHKQSFFLIHILWNDQSFCAVEFLSLWVVRSCCGTCPTRGKAPTLLEPEVRVFWAIGYRIHRLEFQMLAHTEVELFPKEKTVMKNTRGGGLFWQRPFVDTDNKLPVFLSLAGSGLWFQWRFWVCWVLGWTVFTSLSTDPPGIELIVNEPTSNRIKTILLVIRPWMSIHQSIWSSFLSP